MYQPQEWRLGPRRDARRNDARRNGSLPLLILLGGLTFLYAGGDLLFRHFSSHIVHSHRALAAWMLVAVGLVQCRIAVAAWRRRETIDPRRFGLRSSYWRWFLLGPVVCYVVMVLLGADHHGRYPFRAAIGVWYTLMLVPVVRPDVFAGRTFGWARRPMTRRLARVAFLLLFVGVAAELGLRCYGMLSGDRLDAAIFAQQCLLSPGSDLAGRKVNRLGYWDDEFQIERRPGVIRVAVIGDEVTLSGSYESNFLTRIKRSVPGIEIYNFGLPQSGPREYTAILTSQVLAFQPDLVLTCVSVADDITGRLPTPSHFDWQRLDLVQFARRAFKAGFRHAEGVGSQFRSEPGDRPEQALFAAELTPHAVAPPTANTFAWNPAADESYLQLTAGQLAVCHAPLDDRMRRRWRTALGHLEELMAICRSHKIATAMLIAPSVPQLDARLRGTLCRRAGYCSDEVDVHLPQRQLASFAQEQDLPLIDLLPHFGRTEQATFAPSGCQWNDLGNQLAAEALGTWLSQRCATLVARSNGSGKAQ